MKKDAIQLGNQIEISSHPNLSAAAQCAIIPGACAMLWFHDALARIRCSQGLFFLCLGMLVIGNLMLLKGAGGSWG